MSKVYGIVKIFADSNSGRCFVKNVVGEGGGFPKTIEAGCRVQIRWSLAFGTLYIACGGCQTLLDSEVQILVARNNNDTY